VYIPPRASVPGQPARGGVSAILEFLAMGGYAAYVWPAFGTAALVLALLLWNSVARLRSRQATLKALEASTPRRRERGHEAEAPPPRRQPGRPRPAGRRRGPDPERGQRQPAVLLHAHAARPERRARRPPLPPGRAGGGRQRGAPHRRHHRGLPHH